MGLGKRLAAAALAAGMSVTAANAAFVGANDIGAKFTYDFAQTFGGVDLSATSDWELTGYSASGGSAFWTFDVLVSNTTADQAGDNRLTIWGFNTNPSSSVDTATAPATDWFFVTDSNVSSGLGTYQVCAKEAGGNNCTGGGGTGTGAGIFEGDSQSFSFTIETAEADPLEFTSLFVRYQSVGSTGTSTAFEGEERMPPIPLPASALLLLGGIGGLGAMRKLRKAA